MKRIVPPGFLEQVKKLHHSSPDFVPESDVIYTYNVCPLCGVVSKLPPQKSESEVEVTLNVTSDSEMCVTCNNVRHLHPHIHEWVNMLFNNLHFSLQTEVEGIIIMKEQAASKEDYIDAEHVEIISDKSN